MPSSSLSTNPTERLTVKAVKALTSRHPNAPVYLQITVKKNPGKGFPPVGNKRVSSPILVSVPHRAREKKLSDMNICLIVKDPQQKYQKVLEDDTKSPTHDLFTEIVSISKLKSRIAVSAPSSHSKKTPITIDQFDLIVAQKNIIHLLPDIIPSKLYKVVQKVPIPIQLESVKDLKLANSSSTIIDPRLVLFQIKKLVNKSTVLVIPKQGSTCFSVLVGSTNSENMSKLIDNINAAIDGMVQIDAIGGWSNIGAVHIKTPDSISLPVINL